MPCPARASVKTGTQRMPALLGNQVIRTVCKVVVLAKGRKRNLWAYPKLVTNSQTPASMIWFEDRSMPSVCPAGLALRTVDIACPTGVQIPLTVCRLSGKESLKLCVHCPATAFHQRLSTCFSQVIDSKVQVKNLR